MRDYCDIAFTIDPRITVEDLMRSVNQLADYCDVDIDLNTIQVNYDPNGICSVFYVEASMPDDTIYWNRLEESMSNIEGFELDYDSMREWLDEVEEE